MRIRHEAEEIISLRLFTARRCKRIVENARHIEAWENAKVHARRADGAVFEAVRRASRLAKVLAAADWPQLFEGFDRKMNGLVKPLVKRLWSPMLTAYSGTQIVRYPEGGYYSTHTDVQPGSRR